MDKTGTKRDMSGTVPDCPVRDGQGHPPIRVSRVPGGLSHSFQRNEWTAL